jgi:heat-inducible transcriptional repressor
MLVERKAAILRAVVEEYIQTAQPVGSSHVASIPGFSVSSATVRNEMATLERDGYLVQPHTSAGRIPTDKGYRYFVDTLGRPGSLDPNQRQQVRDFFARTHGEIEQMLHDTSSLLSRLTDYAAVIVGPSTHDAATVRSAQLVSLTPRVALLVVVLSNGAIEKLVLDVPEHLGEERLGAASAHLARHLVGHTTSDVADVPPMGDAEVDGVVGGAVAALRGQPDGEDEHVFVGGASRMALAFDAVATVRQVLSILEQQYVVVSLLRDVLDRGLSVAIGTEHGVEPLAECSVIVAPYVVDGEVAGTVGVLGPTRMNYPQAMAAVGIVSKRLSTHLTEG